MLSDTTFHNLIRLGWLIIGECDFSNITNESFKRLHNLEYLFIINPQNSSHMTFSDLPLPRLVLLHVDNVDSFPVELFTMANLLYLSIRFENSDVFSSELLSGVKNSKLKVLHLENCKFSHFNANLLSGFTALRTFKMDTADIERIVFTSNLSDLRALILSNNKIVTIDSTISLLKRLKSIDMAGNRLLKFSPNMFLGLDHLERLQLSGCKGSGEIHMDALNGLKSLIDLDMSNCELTQVHTEAFSHTPKLSKLNLSDNKLKLENAGVLRHLAHLKELHLERNQIGYSSIENGLFSNLLNLEVVIFHSNDIDGNQIDMEELHSKMLENMKKLRKISS